MNEIQPEDHKYITVCLFLQKSSNNRDQEATDKRKKKKKKSREPKEREGETDAGLAGEPYQGESKHEVDVAWEAYWAENGEFMLWNSWAKRYPDYINQDMLDHVVMPAITEVEVSTDPGDNQGVDALHSEKSECLDKSTTPARTSISAEDTDLFGEHAVTAQNNDFLEKNTEDSTLAELNGAIESGTTELNEHVTAEDEVDTQHQSSNDTYDDQWRPLWNEHCNEVYWSYYEEYKAWYESGQEIVTEGVFMLDDNGEVVDLSQVSKEDNSSTQSVEKPVPDLTEEQAGKEAEEENLFHLQENMGSLTIDTRCPTSIEKPTDVLEPVNSDGRSSGTREESESLDSSTDESEPEDGKAGKKRKHAKSQQTTSASTSGKWAVFNSVVELVGLIPIY